VRTTTGETVVAYYALFYEVVPDYLARRGEFREAHLRHAGAAQGRSELLLGGAFAEPADKALLVFRVASRGVVEEFARNDPYVLNGLVARWEVRPWTVVVGTAHSGAGKEPSCT
jgi:uncharacterized protein